MRVFLKLIKQAFSDDKKMYSLIIIFTILLNIFLVFKYIYSELTIDIASSFFESKPGNFIIQIKPIILLVIILLLEKILTVILSDRKLLFTKILNRKHTYRFIEKISILKWECFETEELQTKINLIKNESNSCYIRVAIDFICWIITIFSSIIIYLVYLSKLNYIYIFVYILFLCVYIIIGFYCGKKIHYNYTNTELIRKKRTYLFNVTKNKETHQEIKINRLYNYLTSKWRIYNDKWADSSIKTGIRNTLYSIIPDLFFMIFVFIISYDAIEKFTNGSISIGYFTNIISITIALGLNLRTIFYHFSCLIADTKIYSDYLYLLNIKNESITLNKTLPREFEIEFKNVRYSYPQSDLFALNDISLKIKNGESIAIVGENGSGKSTFINILLELSKTYTGDIKVNNLNINNELGLLRNSCTCIFQDFVQYQFSIKNNISFNNSDISNDKIIEMLNIVGLKDFILNLEYGLDTKLGQLEKGIDLSKGQWQRLALARLLVNEDSRIWILDEPTAYLDPIAEVEMYKFIYQLKKDRTLIFISHRLGFAKYADRILFFKNGKIIEEGTHENLLKIENGEYKKMYEFQKEWYNK